MTHSATTHRFTRRKALLGATMLGIGTSLAKAPSSALAHQEMNDPLAGTTVEQLSAGVSTLVPDRALVLLRVTMEPGTVIPPHSHPGPVALYVDSGTFGTEFFEGSGTVVHAPVDSTPVPPVEVAPGDDVQLPAGDSLFYDGAAHTMRNDGDDTLVLLVSALFDPEAPGFQWMNMGTPEASRIERKM